MVCLLTLRTQKYSGSKRGKCFSFVECSGKGIVLLQREIMRQNFTILSFSDKENLEENKQSVKQQNQKFYQKIKKNRKY